MLRITMRQYVKMPVKIPSTTCVAWSLMKFRRMREVYWLEASARVTRVMENVTPTTVIIEPAMAASIARAPSTLAPKRRGQSSIQSWFPEESISINPRARIVLNATINDGRNQKLSRRLLQRCLSLFMIHSFI
jgi:hypothetical protein